LKWILDDICQVTQKKPEYSITRNSLKNESNDC
jgi:hypothetical protein